ncbi:hypothetical protein, partial [Nonomuraea thailandensis]
RRAAAARRRAEAARRAVTRRASRPSKATVRHRPAVRPTSRKSVTRQSPPKAQRNAPNPSQSQSRGLSEAQKRSIDEQLGRTRPTGAYTRSSRTETEGIAWQGTGHGPASKPYASEAPRSQGFGSKWWTRAYRVWEIFRPPAVPPN